MRKILLTASFLAGLIFQQRTASAQDAPVFSQFFANPFQFNPSYVAHNGYTEANAFYRKQWVGIDNAPSVGAFNIQAPVGRNVALGLSAYTNKTVLLSTNAVMATFGYRVNMGSGQNLNFGLSGGIGFNNFDLNAVENLNDPALMNVVQKSKFTSGQFGVNYQVKKFNIGFAFPKLMDSKPNSLTAYDKIKFDPFRNKFFSASYNIPVKEIDITPMLIYRSIDNTGIQSQWEAMVLATWKKTIWAGISYRDGYGFTGFVGIALKSFRVGYAYEHPTGDISKASSGSQEIYLGARIGKRNRDEELVFKNQVRDSLRQIAKVEKIEKKFKEDSLKSLAEVPAVITPPAETPITKDPVVVAKENPPATNVTTNPPVTSPEIIPEKAPVIVETKPPVVVPAVAEKPVPEPVKLKDNPTAFPDHEGYFIVFGAFRSAENAQKLKNSMRAEGIIGQIIFGEKRKYYYVYTFQTLSKPEAQQQLQKARETKFGGVWMMSADKDLK